MPPASCPTPPAAPPPFESTPLAIAPAPPAPATLGTTLSLTRSGPLLTAYFAAVVVACLATGRSTSIAASRIVTRLFLRGLLDLLLRLGSRALRPSAGPPRGLGDICHAEPPWFSVLPFDGAV